MTTANPDDWFPAQVTAVDDSHDLFAATVYAATEIAVQGDGTVSEKIGGREITALNPAVAVSGGPFAVGDIILVRTARNAGGLLWELVAPAGPGGTWFWAEITGGTDAGGYSWKRKYLSAAATWSDSASPAPLTGTTNAYRAPSVSATTIPAIPAGQVALIRPSPTLADKFEIAPWGGRQAATKTFTIYRYTCSGSSLIETAYTVTVTATGRDLTLDITVA